MIRAKCKRDGHKFSGDIPGMTPAYVFCRRWRCDASAVSARVDPTLAVVFHNAIPWEYRYPQITLNPDGTPQ